MAALATIQNPIVTGPTQECLLFYLTSTSQVAQQQRVPGDKDPQNTPILPQGNIMNPSSFTVLLDKNLVCILWCLIQSSLLIHCSLCRSGFTAL